MNAPSRRSMLIGAAGMLAVGVLWIALSVLDPDSYAFLAVSDLGETFIIAGAAILVLFSAMRMDAGRFRTRWLVIGAGVASYAVGDAIWSYIELVQRSEVPYPGVPDAFYIAEYVLLSGALIAAGVAYSRIIDIRRPALMAAALTALGALGMWIAFIAPLAADTASSSGERFFNVFYPMADVVLLAGPAIFAVLVVSKLGGGKLGRPWWAVVTGVLVLAASDTAFSWMSATDAYRPGTVVDIGWMLAHVAIAFGALIALDLARPVRQRA